MTVLVVAEHDNHALKSDTLHAVMAACQISMFSDGQIHVLVAGVQSRAVAEQAVRINGVGKVLVADAQHTDATNHLVAQVVRMAGGYSHILFSAAASDGSAAPGVAADSHLIRHRANGKPLVGRLSRGGHKPRPRALIG